MTYEELKTQFKAILNRTDITDALTDIFVNQAVQRAQRELRVPGNEKSTDTVVGEDFAGLDVPADYIQTISLTVDDIGVTYMPLTQFRELGDAPVGQPEFWSREANKIQMKPSPAVDATINLYYYGEFEPFDDDEDVLTLGVIAPDLVIYGALAYAADYYIDERATAFEGRFSQILQAIQNQAYDTDGPGAVQPAYNFGSD